MVAGDRDRDCGTNKPGTHIWKSLDDGKEFLVVNLVVEFHRG